MIATFDRDRGCLAARLVQLGREVVPQLSRYTAVSAAAVIVDTIAFYGLATWLVVPAAMAGAAGYAVGLVVHFLLAIRFVFPRSTKSSARLFAEFAASGLMGLVMTAAVIWIGTELVALPLLVAKASAVGASFFAVYVLRRQLVFAPIPSPSSPQRSQAATPLRLG